MFGQHDDLDVDVYAVRSHNHMWVAAFGNISDAHRHARERFEGVRYHADGFGVPASQQMPMTPGELVHLVARGYNALDAFGDLADARRMIDDMRDQGRVELRSVPFYPTGCTPAALDMHRVFADVKRVAGQLRANEGASVPWTVWDYQTDAEGRFVEEMTGFSPVRGGGVYAYRPDEAGARQALRDHVAALNNEALAS